MGVSQNLTLVFSKDDTSDQTVDVQQITLKLNAQAQYIELEDRILAQGNLEGLINDDEDDYRILDSLPVDVTPKQGRIFNQLISSIEIVGFNITAVPAITNLTYFMNQSFFLQNKGRQKDTEKVDLLTS